MNKYFKEVSRYRLTINTIFIVALIAASWLSGYPILSWANIPILIYIIFYTL